MKNEWIGSEEQVKWAKDIVREAIEKVESALAAPGLENQPQEVQDKLKTDVARVILQLKSLRDAKIIIDHRQNLGNAIFTGQITVNLIAEAIETSETIEAEKEVFEDDIENAEVTLEEIKTEIDKHLNAPSQLKLTGSKIYIKCQGKPLGHIEIAQHKLIVAHRDLKSYLCKKNILELNGRKFRRE